MTVVINLLGEDSEESVSSDDILVDPIQDERDFQMERNLRQKYQLSLQVITIDGKIESV